MNVSRTVVVTVVVLLIALLGFGAYAFAQSDNNDGPPWRDDTPWQDGRRWGPWHEGRRWGPWHGPAADPERFRELRSELAADLGTELDISGEEVEAAFRGVVAQRLEEAAEAGRIDQDAVDEALAAYDEGDIRALFQAFKRDLEATTESP